MGNVHECPVCGTGIGECELMDSGEVICPNCGTDLVLCYEKE